MKYYSHYTDQMLNPLSCKKKKEKAPGPYLNYLENFCFLVDIQ